MEFSPGLAHLRGTLGDSLTAAAQRLVERGCVSDVRVLQAGAVVTGIAAAEPRPGTEPRTGANAPNAHRIYVRRRSSSIESECSCGERSPCVHVAAVLIVASGEARTPEGARPSAEPASFQAAPGAAADSSALRQRIYYLVEAAGVDQASGFRVCVWVAQAASDSRHIQPNTACLFSIRIMAGLARREALPRYVDEQDREILQALTARNAEGPWELHDADAAVLLQRIVGTGRAFWQALRGEPIEPHELWNDVARHAPAQKRPPSSPKAKLVVAADLKVTLHFNYDGLGVDSRVVRFNSLRDGASTFSIAVADDVYEIERDPQGERRLQLQLDQLMPSLPQDPEAWMSFMLDAVPILQAQGWEVAVASGFPYRIATAERWYADLQSNTGRPAEQHPRHAGRQREWFDLRLGVSVDGLDVNLLPALVSYLQTKLEGDGPSQGSSGVAFHRMGERLLIRLDDGRYLPVALERIERIASALVELFDREPLNARQALPVSTSEASRLAQLAQELTAHASLEAPSAGLSLRSNDRSMLVLLEELKSFNGIEPLAAPGHFSVALRPYQEEGLGWLQFLRRCRLGGILADDMGLGKTVQTLAHLVLEKDQGRLHKPALIVAPVSVIGNWHREVSRFAPQLKSLVLHGSKRRESFPAIDTADVVITGYPQLQLDGEVLLARQFSFVILDEAQTIKNPRAKVSQAARALHADHHLCLTGTPMENHLGELWSLFEFAQPGLLGPEQAFSRHYRTPIEKHGDHVRADALTRRIAPFILRRTKDAVAKELPDKTQIVESIVMDDEQRDLYDSIRLAMHGRVREVIEQHGLARSRITVLHALLKLRQACCDPRLVAAQKNGSERVEGLAAFPGVDAAAEAIPSAKMDWLTTALPELVAEGRRVLVFSQFTSMLALIEAAVAQLAIPCLTLTGATRERDRLVQRFQAGEAPVFLISLKAGGTGLNLTAADTVIHYDPWWNPAAEAQATDRAHRIGQDKPVFIHKLICQNTVEEKILQLQADKQALAGRLHAGENAAPGALSAADLEALFAP